MYWTQTVASLLAVGSALARPSLIKKSVDFDWADDVVRGLNIGGWLVLEPFITPSIFQKLDGVVDEFTLGQKLGQDAALKILEPHWQSWVQRSDFQRIKDSGFNLVRIPVGYWAFQTFPGEPYTPGAAKYLDNAVGWARDIGLKVVVDLHGAPGSQNGYDNSGHRKDTIGFEKGDTVKQTLQVLQKISDAYAHQQDVVVAIEVLNEPFGPNLDMDVLKQFYRDGYGKVRSDSDTWVMLHDAFETESYWNNFLTPQDKGSNVILDHHEYQVFDNEMIQWSNEEVCNMQTKLQGADKLVVVGEWTAAQTDCAPALNGYGIGSRYEGLYPNSTKIPGRTCGNINFFNTWDQQLKDDTRGYIEAQMEVFERNTRGWIFWNFKTESAPEWSAFQLLDGDVFPQPLTDRKFGMICS